MVLPGSPEPAVISPDASFASATAIGRRAARGGILLILRNGFVQGLQVVSSIVLAQAITPNEYGAFAIAAALVGFARAIGDLGLGQSLVVNREFDERDLRTAAAIVLSTSISVGALVALAGVTIDAGLLSGANAAALTAAYAGTLVVDALRFGPIVRLMRALRFREIALATTAEALAGYALQVLLLLCGLGVWALVLGGYARSITGVLVYAHLGGPIARPQLGDRTRALLREGLPYQGPIVLMAALGVLLPLIVAADLGARDLGLWAWSTILAVPVAQALITIQSVLLPSLARLHGQYRDQFQAACDRSARLIALLAAAGAAALFGLAPELVEQIFGAKWIPATNAVQVTLLGIVPLALLQLLSAVLASQGQAAVRLRCALIASLVSLAVIYPLMRLAGITGAAIASAVVWPTADVLLLARVAHVPLRRTGLNIVTTLGSVGAVSLLLGRVADTPTRLAGACIAVVMAALVLAWVIDRSVLRYAWSLLRKPDAGASTADAS
jgi:O-antigen/teichoic acid export membrane protein